MKYVYFFLVFMLLACSENYSNGDRVGYIVKFSQKGMLFDSWEGEINLTQSGMATSNFEFSIDNDVNSPALIDSLKVAMQEGYKVKLTYHQVKNFNCFNNRGETDYFVTSVQYLQ